MPAALRPVGPKGGGVILPTDLYRLALQGRKRQHRIPANPGMNGHRYRPGHSVPIRPEGREGGHTMRAMVVDVFVQNLAEFTDRDAVLEGFPTADEFFGYWTARYSKQSVRCRRPAPYVWVICFDLDPDTVRLLAPAARPRGDEHGYTANRASALPDEPEAVDVAVLDSRWKKGATQRFGDALSEERARRKARALAQAVRERVMRGPGEAERVERALRALDDEEAA